MSSSSSEFWTKEHCGPSLKSQALTVTWKFNEQTLHRWALQIGFASSIRSTVNRSQPGYGWIIILYGRHCGLGAVARFASISRSWVKPIVRLAKTHIVNLGAVPRISNRRGERFDWKKTALVERISFDSEVLESLHKIRIKAPISV